MDTIKLNQNKVKMIAHRGLSKIEKENTMCAFIAASNRSYYGLECDIHKTKDGRYVIIHDDETLRVSGVNLEVATSTIEELQAIHLLDIDNSHPVDFYRIPLLEDYLKCAKKYQKKCIIEFKNPYEKADIKEVLDIIKAYEYLDECIFISFYPENLIEIRRLLPNQKLQFLTSEYEEKRRELCFTYNFSLDVNYPTVTKEIIDDFHNHNLEVNVWTVDDYDLAVKLIDMGVDYLTTNILE